MTLNEFFVQHPKVALAYSGGTDSAYLLYMAAECGADVHAYYVKTAFQPKHELSGAQRLAQDLGVPLSVLDMDILKDARIKSNPANRCYYCKKAIMNAIQQAAAADGYTLILDGTNASDSAPDRPGMRALDELHVVSPLRDCGLTKSDIRALSKEAGLVTWDKPADACLATRALPNTPITVSGLRRTELAEASLRDLGFTDFRVRDQKDGALIQVTADQLQLALEHRKDILETLKPAYGKVWLDLETRS